MAQSQPAHPATSPLGTHLLASPDEIQLPWPVETAWRAAVPTTTGLASPEEILRSSKPVALAARGERALLAALAADDGHAVMEHAGRPGEHQLAAAVLAALRLTDHLPDRALSLLTWARSSKHDLGSLRFIRRYLPNLAVFTQIDHSMRLWTPADSSGLALLEAELLDRAGRAGEALAVRQTMPPGALQHLTALSEASRAGLHEQVLSQTQRVDPTADEFQCAMSILRGRALQGLGRLPAALELFNQISSTMQLTPSLRVWVLRGQAELLAATGRSAEAELAAAERASLRERLLGQAEGGGPGTGPSPAAVLPAAQQPATTQLPLAPPAQMSGSASANHPGPAGTGGAATPSSSGSDILNGRPLAVAIEDAGARVRRQPRRSDAPGTLGGRSQEDFQDEVDELIAGGHLAAAESLLLTLLDSVDAAVDAGQQVDPTHFITLAGLFSQQNMPPEELATLRRLIDAYARSDASPPEAVVRQADHVEADLARLPTY